MNMKTIHLTRVFFCALLAIAVTHCGEKSSSTPAPSTDAQQSPAAGQSAVQDDLSQKNVVKVAIGSKDHTTLVKAVVTAEYVDVLSNAGPFTVFAPTNAAFDKLPPGTVADLLKPDNKAKLRDILEYHVAVGTYRADMLRDGQTLNMANSGDVKVSVKDGKIMLNGTATIVGSVPASNGIVHVVDSVVLQPAK
jgi:uncharacterized surface protein with fasciclin (FAS1) repeats